MNRTVSRNIIFAAMRIIELIIHAAQRPTLESNVNSEGERLHSNHDAMEDRIGNSDPFKYNQDVAQIQVARQFCRSNPTSITFIYI